MVRQSYLRKRIDLHLMLQAFILRFLGDQAIVATEAAATLKTSFQERFSCGKPTSAGIKK